jgi:putative spermidine/putrescine transport system permease protein
LASRTRPDIVTAIKLTGWVAAAFLVLPPLVVIPMSFSAGHSLQFPPREWTIEPYRRLVTQGVWRAAAVQSLCVAVCVAIFAVAIGLAGAYALQHAHVRLRLSMTLFVLLPLMVPPVVLAVGQFLMLARLRLVDSTLGLVFAHTVLTVPLSFLIFLSAFTRTDLRLERAARTLGATRAFAFWKVTWPQVQRAAALGAILAFITSFDEPVLSLFLTSTHARTLPRQMFDAARYDLDPTMAAASSVLMALSIVLVFVAGAYQTVPSRRV